jgi:cell division protein FtsZ
MTLNLNVPKTQANLMPRITVIGVGGAGGNAVNNMILANLEGVEFLIANTDAQAIQQSMCQRCIQLGRNITQGLGAGSRPDIGRAAAEEALDEILGQFEGTNMVFITAGMGGGTGTGGAPVIARAAREAGILTVGVVTKPFHFEGVHRMRMAEAGINELTEHVDTLIVIPNQNLFRVANEKTTFADAFKMADDVLHSGVRGVTDLMVMPGLINLDFADIRAVMTEMGKAMMGTGYAEGENRSIAAAESAISNPLLDDVSMKGARGVLINVTGGPDMTLFEVDETANRIREEVDPDANIIFGSTFDQNMSGGMRVSVVATGIDAEAMIAPRPVTLSLVAAQGTPAPSTAKTETTPPAAEKARETATDQPVAETPSIPSAAPPAHAPLPGQRRAIGGDGFVANHAATATAVIATATAPAMAAQTEPQTAPAEADSVMAAPATQTAEDAAPRRFAVAAAADGAQAPRSLAMDKPSFDRKRAQSLFAKMTSGAARALQTAAQSGEQRNPYSTGGGNSSSIPGPATAQPVSAARPVARAEPLLPSTAPVAAPAAIPAATPRPAAHSSVPSEPAASPQTRLTGLEPAERSPSEPSEEDLLEIPAFLRRQAN